MVWCQVIAKQNQSGMVTSEEEGRGGVNEPGSVTAMTSNFFLMSFLRKTNGVENQLLISEQG
jgi:hypothetical protein